jgi:DNA-binding NtrC family response regulator
MGQLANLTLALIVGPENTRNLAGTLFEGSNFQAREVDSCEAALRFLAREGLEVGVCFADLAGCPDGDCTNFAREVARDYPWVKIVISTSQVNASMLPANTKIVDHPWAPLDIIRHAEHASSEQRLARLASH